MNKSHYLSMGFAISLAVPEEDRTVETLKEYCEKKRGRRGEIKPNEDWEPVEEMSDFVVGVSMLEETGKLIINEEVPRKAVEAIGGERLYELFQSDNSHEYATIYNQDIKKLRELLIGSEELLRETSNVSFNPKLVLRAGPVVLCDFALEHGYGIDTIS